MSICYNETTRTFKLDTPDSSYVMGVPDSSGHLIHYYWGKRLMTDRAAYLARTDESPFTPDTNERDKVGFMDTAPFEYPAGGAGDFRERCLDISDSSGRNGLELSYVSHLIVPGKPEIPGLPSVAGAAGDCSTLSVIMADAVAGIEVTLNYSVFEKLNVITRSAVITNKSGGSVYLNRALSVCLDIENTDYSLGIQKDNKGKGLR